MANSTDPTATQITLIAADRTWIINELNALNLYDSTLNTVKDTQSLYPGGNDGLFSEIYAQIYVSVQPLHVE